MSEAGPGETTSQDAPRPDPAAGGPERTALQRVIGALRLDGATYDEIAADPAALGQAAAVAAVAAIARGIGDSATTSSGAALVGVVSVFAFWPLGSLLIWAIGSWFGHPSELPRVLRVVGFAMAPLVLAIAGIVPSVWLRAGVLLLATALFLAALVIGTREALRVPTGRAAFVCLVALLSVFFLMMVVVYVASVVGA